MIAIENTDILSDFERIKEYSNTRTIDELMEAVPPRTGKSVSATNWILHLASLKHKYGGSATYGYCRYSNNFRKMHGMTMRRKVNNGYSKRHT